MMNSHEIDFELFGDDMQFVEIELDPRETVVAEAGAMMIMDSSIEMETIFGDGSNSSGSGGFFGTLNSLANDGTSGYASQYVPEIQTDFIFSQVCQQWGTFGAICLLTLYGILISRMINIARTAKDIFGSILATGMIAYFLFAIWQNIGMTIGLMPITGITLPLVSYGGSSLATTILSLGLVLNIGMRRTKLNF